MILGLFRTERKTIKLFFLDLIVGPRAKPTAVSLGIAFFLPHLIQGSRSECSKRLRVLIELDKEPS